MASRLAPGVPFEPSEQGFEHWLMSLPPQARMDLALFFVTVPARQAAAAVVDATVAELVKQPGATYESVGAALGWGKSNVQRRITRYHKRHGIAPSTAGRRRLNAATRQQSEQPSRRRSRKAAPPPV